MVLQVEEKEQALTKENWVVMFQDSENVNSGQGLWKVRPEHKHESRTRSVCHFCVSVFNIFQFFPFIL